MYLEYYGLSQEPFHITPDPYFFYLSPSHKESFASLIYGLQNRKGFIALTGEVGLGKTTVLRAFLNKLSTETKIKTVFVFNPDLSFKGLLLTMYSELGLELPASCKTAPGSESSLSIQDQVFELVQGLHQALIREYENNCSVILVIDEAQNMPLPTLENLRMLSNLETSRDKLLQIFLIGQTELDRILDKLELRQLRQRIAIRTVLQPLSSRESKDYILHRLKLAGAVKELFTPAALRLITRYSRGVPRKINILCNNALVTGYGYGSKVITPKIVREAINDLEGRQSGQKRFKYALAAGLALAVIGAGLWLGPYKSWEKLIPWNKHVDMSSQEITLPESLAALEPLEPARPENEVQEKEPLESAAADAHLPAAAGDEAPP
ncbi:AAA family ATPase, partial [Desulfonatronospira sp.]|uniref:ExeA family protein n=1 Tax=Desulfonatronospira sp. TaxID=1962951 RepID=UPI0025BD755C